MKRCIYFLMVVLALTLTSCDKKSSNSSTTAPDFTSGNWKEHYNTILMLSPGSISLDIAGDHPEYILVIDEEMVAPNYVSFNQENGFTHYSYPYYSEPGETIDYSVMGSKAEISGSIKIPYVVYMNYYEFDQDSNYTIDWTTHSNPLTYILAYWFEDVYNNSTDDLVQISGSKRSYTINKSKWNDLNEVTEWDIELYALNYKKHGSTGIAVSYLYDDKDKSMGSANHNKNNAGKRNDSLLNRIIKGELLFP